MTNDWQTVQLGEVLKQDTNYVTELEPKIYPKLSVKLYGKGVVLDAPTDGANVKMQRHQFAKPGQIILSEIWAKKGAIGIVPKEGEGALVTSHFFLFDVDETKVMRDWVGLLLKRNYFADTLDAQARGTTGYAAVRPKQFLALEIPLPPLTEQRRIVEDIESLAARVNEAQRLREEADAATNALTASETTLIFEKLEGYPKIQLGKLGEDGSNPIQTGPFGSQLLTTEFVDEGIPVLNVGNVQPDGLKLSKLDHVTPEKAATLTRYSLQENDLLFARTGATLGKVCLLPKGCDGWLMTGHLFRVRFDTSCCDPNYVFVALRGAESVRKQVFGQIRGATRPGFNTSLLSQVELPLPPLDEQRRIAAHLAGLQAKVNALRELQSASGEELSSLMLSILDKAFKGEL